MFSYIDIICLAIGHNIRCKLILYYSGKNPADDGSDIGGEGNSESDDDQSIMMTMAMAFLFYSFQIKSGCLSGSP